MAESKIAAPTLIDNSPKKNGIALAATSTGRQAHTPINTAKATRMDICPKRHTSCVTFVTSPTSTLFAKSIAIENYTGGVISAGGGGRFVPAAREERAVSPIVSDTHLKKVMNCAPSDVSRERTVSQSILRCS